MTSDGNGNESEHPDDESQNDQVDPESLAVIAARTLAQRSSVNSFENRNFEEVPLV
jgi:hypothetical protein